MAAEVRSQYRHFVVDEFQDVSPVQMALLSQWLGDRDELCVVGDPAQTIYSFAGADPRFLLDFPARFPGTRTLELVRNYRSTPEVVEAANRLLEGAPIGSVRLRAQSPSGDPVAYREYDDEVAETAAAVEEIRRLVAAGTPGIGHRDPVPGQRPVRAGRGGAERSGHPVRRAGGRAVLPAPRSPSGDHPAARGRTRRLLRRRRGDPRRDRLEPRAAGRTGTTA